VQRSEAKTKCVIEVVFTHARVIRLQARPQDSPAKFQIEGKRVVGHWPRLAVADR